MNKTELLRSVKYHLENGTHYLINDLLAINDIKDSENDKINILYSVLKMVGKYSCNIPIDVNNNLYVLLHSIMVDIMGMSKYEELLDNFILNFDKKHKSRWLLQSPFVEPNYLYNGLNENFKQLVENNINEWINTKNINKNRYISHKLYLTNFKKGDILY